MINVDNRKVPAADVAGFLKQLNCTPSGRNYYVDWGNGNVDILQTLLERPINDPVSVDNVIDYAVKVGKDLTEGGWFYYNFGQTTSLDSDGKPHYEDGKIGNMADLKAEKPASLENQFERLEEIIAKAGKHNLGVRADILSFFTDVYLGMGYERFFMALYDDKAFVEYFLDYMLELYIPVAERLCKYPITAVMIDSDLCNGSGPMVSPAVLEELWLSRMQKLVDVFHKAKIPVMFHCDGALDKVLDYFVDLGGKSIHPIEPAFNDIYALKQQYKGKICLMGNIDIAGVMLTGTTQDVYDNVTEHLDRLSGGGGYMVSTSTSYFPENMPTENFLAMIKAVHEHQISS